MNELRDESHEALNDGQKPLRDAADETGDEVQEGARDEVNEQAKRLSQSSPTEKSKIKPVLTARKFISMITQTTTTSMRGR